MTYFYLAIAIIAEVAATSALKASAEFTRLVPSLIVVVGYGIAFYFMTLVLAFHPGGNHLCRLGGTGYCAGDDCWRRPLQGNPGYPRRDWHRAHYRRCYRD